MLQSPEGEEKEMPLPEGELGEEIERSFDKYKSQVIILVISWENEEAVISFKAPDDDDE